MKQQFINKRFSQQSEYIIQLAEKILSEYREQGYKLSLRQLYYQMIAQDILPDSWRDKVTNSKNSIQSYKKIGDIVSDARLAGLLDWDMIEDRGREACLPAAWESPASIIMTAAQQFRVDRWEGQENYVEVMVEKDALSGILQPVCSKYHVRFTANKGYSSSSAMYETGRRINDALTQQNGSLANQAHIFYLGDHDPSGIDMTRDITERLALFAGIDSDEYCDGIIIHRIALNFNQVKLWKPPENPAKQTDSRYEKYVDEFGESSWELDAVEPGELVRLLEEGIANLIDQEQWDLIAEREETMRNELLEYAKNYRKKRNKE